MPHQNAIPLKQIPSNKISSTKNQHQPIYFQHQDINLLCGMHSLNNFLGLAKYNVDSMNKICYLLAEGKKVFNPHKHCLMQGDYDVNVLMYALEESGFVTKWHDKRKKIEVYDVREVQGFLVNIQVKTTGWFKWSGLCCASGRHWLTIKKLNHLEQQNPHIQQYILLDSSKQTYQRKSQQQILNYLNQAQQQTAQIIFINKLVSKKSLKK